MDQKAAEDYYNQRIYSYFQTIHGTVLDLGCGGGFLSRFMLANNPVTKVYGLDRGEECANELADLTKNGKFQFIQADVSHLNNLFAERSLDFLVSRDVFMFISNTDRYFNDVTKLVNCGIRQMGWFMKDSRRMKNHLRPEQIAHEYRQRGWTVHLESLDWYKSGYFIRADR
ncbi:class I SAM-dependent methyltransferase [Sporolactobacillus sp. STCC-11]|uniref:class I SAM-dependent methyltransferase n=1 Tax=Sporolactobacillus caesalpiniae TaxID=3230362 RepID=UPI003393E041